MSIRPETEPDLVETVPGRLSIDQTLFALGILVAAVIASLLAGPGLGLLVVTLAVLAGALWIAYAGPPDSARDGSGLQTPSASYSSGLAPVARPPRSLPSIQRPSFTIDRATILSLGFLASAGSILVIAGAGAFLYLKDRRINPPGFFADEAEIGVQTWKLLHFQADTTPIPFFYHHLEYNHLGTLSLFATAPFVALFGLTAEAVRGASAFWTIAAAIVIYLTLRRLKVPYAVVPVLAMMMSPLLVLIARTNFGHAASLMAMSLGYFAWVCARQTDKSWLPVAAGVAIGLSAYGQPSYYIAAPLLLIAIAIVEGAFNRRQWSAYSGLVRLGLGALVIMLPIPYRALTYGPFLDRYRDKTEGAVHGIDRLSGAIRMYPDYFSYDMLFVHGTTGWQTRHSIPGAPWLYAPMLLFLLVGLISLIVVRGDPSKRFFWPMALVLFFYPLPDIASRPAGDNPYSFSLVWGIIGIPFVLGYGLIGIRRLVRGLPISRPSLAYAAVMLLAVLISTSGFWQGAFANYPNVSADYWGWQYGPEPITDYFKAHADEYDEFFMSGDFNAAYILEEFYMHGSPIAPVTRTGGLEQLDLTKRQLFAVRISEWTGAKGSQYPSRSYLKLVDTIDYPDGSPAFYLLTADPSLILSGGQADQTPTG